MKTYLKTLARTFKRHITRFISIILMVLVAVGFIAGIGTTTEKLKYSLTDYYKAQNVGDFVLKSTKDSGFSEEDIAKVRDIYGATNVNCGFSADVNLKIAGEERLTRLYFLDFDNWTVNVPDFIDGERATDEFCAYAESADNKIKQCGIGTEIEIDFKDILSQLSGEETPLPQIVKTVKVCGVIQSPLTFAKDGEPSYNNPSDTKVPNTIGGVNELITLESVLYLSAKLIPTLREIYSLPYMPQTPVLPTGDMYVAVNDREVFQCFDKNYKKLMDEQTELLSAQFATDGVEENVKILTLYDNYSFVSFDAYADKVMGIGLVLMVAFLLVTVLVVLSNMTRFMEEERAQIACLKTLGYSSFKIIFKYVLFAALANGVGGTGAYFIGIGLAYLLCYVFNYSFAMPPVSSNVAVVFFVIIFSVIAAATLLATVLSGLKLTRETPASLLRPKPPKAGKKVFLEKIPFIWNRLAFRYKSTARNVLRYLSRFIMTVAAVAVSTALVMAGFALLDECLFGSIDSPSVMGVAAVVVIFAGFLTAVVIYTLTNINVSERQRELATLMVLGYHTKEVCGYVYREVYVDAAVGIIFGYPLSVPIIMLLFSIIECGSVGGVSWFWWPLTPFVVFLFTFIVTLLLRRKIVGIDMNESLKAVE